MSMHPRVFIVVLHWRNVPDTLECLASLARLSYSDFSVLVVANGSPPGEYEAVLDAIRTDPRMRAERLQRNLGYTGGNNFGLEEGLGSGAEFMLLLNNDTVVDPGFLEPLVAYASEHARAGILTPKIVYCSDPGVVWSRGGDISWLTGAMKSRGKGARDRREWSAPERVRYVLGCAMFIRAATVRRVGLLDDGYFLYAEDCDYSTRARRAGYDLFCIGTSLVRHKVSRSAGALSPFYLYYQARNRLRYLKKSYPLPAFVYWSVVHVAAWLPMKLGRVALERGPLAAAAVSLLRGTVDGLIQPVGRRPDGAGKAIDKPGGTNSWTG